METKRFIKKIQIFSSFIRLFLIAPIMQKNDVIMNKRTNGIFIVGFTKKYKRLGYYVNLVCLKGVADINVNDNFIKIDLDGK